MEPNNTELFRLSLWDELTQSISFSKDLSVAYHLSVKNQRCDTNELLNAVKKSTMRSHAILDKITECFLIPPQDDDHNMLLNNETPIQLHLEDTEIPIPFQRLSKSPDCQLMITPNNYVIEEPRYRSRSPYQVQMASSEVSSNMRIMYQSETNYPSQNSQFRNLNRSPSNTYTSEQFRNVIRSPSNTYTSEQFRNVIRSPSNTYTSEQFRNVIRSPSNTYASEQFRNVTRSPINFYTSTQSQQLNCSTSNYHNPTQYTQSYTVRNRSPSKSRDRLEPGSRNKYSSMTKRRSPYRSHSRSSSNRRIRTQFRNRNRSRSGSFHERRYDPQSSNSFKKKHQSQSRLKKKSRSKSSSKSPIPKKNVNKNHSTKYKRPVNVKQRSKRARPSNNDDNEQQSTELASPSNTSQSKEEPMDNSNTMMLPQSQNLYRGPRPYFHPHNGATPIFYAQPTLIPRLIRPPPPPYYMAPRRPLPYRPAYPRMYAP